MNSKGRNNSQLGNYEVTGFIYRRARILMETALSTLDFQCTYFFGYVEENANPVQNESVKYTTTEQIQL